MAASEADFLWLGRSGGLNAGRDECKEWRNAFIPPAKISCCSNRGVKERVAGLLVIRRFIAYNWKLDVEKA